MAIGWPVLQLPYTTGATLHILLVRQARVGVSPFLGPQVQATHARFLQMTKVAGTSSLQVESRVPCTFSNERAALHWRFPSTTSEDFTSVRPRVEGTCIWTALGDWRAAATGKVVC